MALDAEQKLSSSSESPACSRDSFKAAANNSTVITTLPITADLVGRLSAKRWIYYCVDDFSVWPGLSGEVLREMELELISKVDCVIAVSDHLVDAIRPYKSDVQLLTHGVDVDFWKCNEINPTKCRTNSTLLGRC